MTVGRQAERDGRGMRMHGRRPSCALALGLAALAGAADAVPPAADAAAIDAAVRTAGLGPAIDDARFLLAAGRAREAAGVLTDALAAGRQADAGRIAAAEALLAQAHAAERGDDTVSDEAARAGAAGHARTRADDGVAARADQRRERIARIADLRARGLRELALANCRKLLSDLPGDEEVDGLFRAILAEAHQARSAAIAQREQDLRAEVAQMVERSLIPEGFDGQPIYPSDWTVRRSGRHSELTVSERPPAWVERISDSLAGRISLQLDGAPVSEALELIARLGGINIVTAPDILAATDRTITLRAAGMRLDSVLTWICEQAATRWGMANGAIFVGEQGEGQRTTAIHDIAGLLVGAGDFPGPRIAFNAGDGDGAGFDTATETGTPPPSADDVAELIRRSVSPRAWQDDGNGIVVRGNLLFITAPDATQRLVQEFLRAQASQRSLSVRMETRWLELADGYVEQIGVEWTSGAGTLINPDADAGPGIVRSGKGWSLNGATHNFLPGTSVSAASDLADNGLTLQTAILGNHGLSAVLHAVERNSQGRVLQAPELVCLNGQRAHAFFGSQIAYISDYEVSDGDYDPVIEIVNIGTSIDMRPLASADRKYVTLELRSSIADATLFTDYITTANPDDRTGIDSDGDGIIDLYFGLPMTYPIELPNISVRSMATSVMIPDRGSMLVGGFNRSIDEFSATRVPLLGSIPFLGRLFGARGRYAQRANLYLLTTVTIINYPELEARL